MRFLRHCRFSCKIESYQSSAVSEQDFKDHFELLYGRWQILLRTLRSVGSLLMRFLFAFLQGMNVSDAEEPLREDLRVDLNPIRGSVECMHRAPATKKARRSCSAAANTDEDDAADDEDCFANER